MRRLDIGGMDWPETDSRDEKIAAVEEESEIRARNG
jgi:hypothetical protein